jgi:hypothetical protein
MRGLEGKRILVTGGERYRSRCRESLPPGRIKRRGPRPRSQGPRTSQVRFARSFGSCRSGRYIDEVSKAFAQTFATMGCVDVLIN